MLTSAQVLDGAYTGKGQLALAFPSFLQEQSVSHSALLFSEVRAEFVFLLFRQVGLNDLKLLAFDGISNLV
jgi:hypothetical protein